MCRCFCSVPSHSCCDALRFLFSTPVLCKAPWLHELDPVSVDKILPCLTQQYQLFSGHPVPRTHTVTWSRAKARKPKGTVFYLTALTRCSISVPRIFLCPFNGSLNIKSPVVIGQTCFLQILPGPHTLCVSHLHRLLKVNQCTLQYSIRIHL